MAAHLRELPRCQTCQAPATQALHNAVNALIGLYCARHGKAALRDFQRRHES